jgi:hypothetical protein
VVSVNMIWKPNDDNSGMRHETIEAEAAYTRDGMLVIVNSTAEQRYERYIPQDRFHEFTIVKATDKPISQAAIDALAGGTLKTAGRIPRRDLFQAAQRRTNVPEDE